MPLATATVSLRTLDGDSLTKAITDQTGYFVLPIFQEHDEYLLSIDCEGYYELPWRDTWELRVSRNSVHVRLSMQPKLAGQFQVRDEQGDRVTEFGLVIGEIPTTSKGRRSWSATRNPEVAIHPDGMVRLVAEPGLDAYKVLAPGFAPLMGLVRFDTPGRRWQEIVLERGGTVKGRVLVEGRPTEHARIGCIDRGISGPYPPDEDLEEAIVRSRRSEIENDLTASFQHPTIRTTSGADGRFSFSDLPHGYHLLEIGVDREWGLETTPVYVSPGAVVDLGNLEMKRSK